jgi:alkanesulfonate monooxygenase
MSKRVAKASEDCGFEYMLILVNHRCWDAWMTAALKIGHTKKIKMPVAARPSYINLVLLAKMISMCDQLSGGRLPSAPRTRTRQLLSSTDR